LLNGGARRASGTVHDREFAVSKSARCAAPTLPDKLAGRIFAAIGAGCCWRLAGAGRRRYKPGTLLTIAPSEGPDHGD
jgi:hypothetical protein